MTTKNKVEYTALKVANRAYDSIMDAGLKVMDPWLKTFIADTTFGAGSVKELPDVLKKAGIHHPLLVTDSGVEQAQLTPILNNLNASGFEVSVYDKIEENPTVESIEEARKQYLKEHCDGLIGLGGGSSMDAAKAIGARVVKKWQPITKMGGLFRVLKYIPPMVAIPTTAGTGSEVTMGAVVSDHKKQRKYALMDPFIMPKYAIMDPELSVSLNPFYTATTGMDALTHAVESYVTWGWNTNESNRNAEDAIVKIFRYLEKAYNDGNDIEARDQMLLASYQAGLAFNRTAVGYVHAIAHNIAGIYNTPHGATNAVLLPIVLEEYGAAVEDRLAHLAEITGVKDTGSNRDKSRAFIAEIRAMNRRMNIQTGLPYLEEKNFERIAKLAMKEAFSFYPSPVVFSKEEIRHILNRALLEA